MKLMIFSTSSVYETLVSKLTLLGHEVELITPADLSTLFYGWPDAEEYAQRRIEAFQPTHILNNIPALSITSSATYIGNSTASARLETHRWETRQKANELGFLLPEVLEECTMDGISQTYTEDVYLKPKGWDTHHRSWKIPANTSHELHNSRFIGDSSPAFIEREVAHNLEAICMFTISNGSYNIQYMTGYIGGGNEKIFGADEAAWKTNTRYEPLSSDLINSWETQCTRWLDYVVTLGGSYQGAIGAGVTDDGFYWYEQNSRRGTGVTFIGDANEWWESLTLDCSKASSSHWDISY